MNQNQRKCDNPHSGSEPKKSCFCGALNENLKSNRIPVMQNESLQQLFVSFQPTTQRAASMFVRSTSRNWWDSRKSASWLATLAKRWPIAIENQRNFQLTSITNCQHFWRSKTSSPQPRGVRDAWQSRRDHFTWQNSPHMKLNNRVFIF